MILNNLKELLECVEMLLKLYRVIQRNYLIRIELFGDTVERICEVDPLTGHILGSYNTYTIYPAYGYVTKKEQC